MKAELFWMDGTGPGRLAIAPRPRGGDWLEDEIRSWQQAGVNIVVSALTEEEVTELNLIHEEKFCRALNLEFVACPIADREVPASVMETRELVQPLALALAKGKNVLIHCRQGVGRSALLAASLLVLAEVDPETAFAQIRAARGCPVPDTKEQRDWVVRFARG